MTPRTCFAVTRRGMKPNNGSFVELAIVFGLEVRIQVGHYHRDSATTALDGCPWKRGLRSAVSALRSLVSGPSATGEPDAESIMDDKSGDWRQGSLYRDHL
jgi:hypothetical protein